MIISQLFAWFHIDPKWIWVLFVQNFQRSLPITCSWHVFTNSESTNSQLFSQKMSFLLKEMQSAFFFEKKSFNNIFVTKKFYLVLNKNKNNFVKRHCGFVDSWFVKKYVTNMLLFCKQIFFERIFLKRMVFLSPSYSVSVPLPSKNFHYSKNHPKSVKYVICFSSQFFY